MYEFIWPLCLEYFPHGNVDACSVERHTCIIEISITGRHFQDCQFAYLSESIFMTSKNGKSYILAKKWQKNTSLLGLRREAFFIKPRCGFLDGRFDDLLRRSQDISLQIGIHISSLESLHPTLIPDTMLIAGDIDLPQSTISVSIGYFYEAPRDGPPTVLPICRGDELSPSSLLAQITSESITGAWKAIELRWKYGCSYSKDSTVVRGWM